MAYWDASALDVYNRLGDWLQYNATDNNVENLPLDLIIRAENKLWEERDWLIFTKESDLTLSSKAATLPSDFGRMIYVYHDDDDDGIPDFYYYLNDLDSTRRYTISVTINRTTGLSKTITFANDPSSTPTIRYVADFDDLTTSNYSTAKLIFPAELTLLTAQKIHILDRGLKNERDKLTIEEQERALIKFIGANEGRNIASRQYPRDAEGVEVILPKHTLDGYRSVAPSSRGRANDYRWA